MKFKEEMGILGEYFTHIILRIKEKLPVSIMRIFINLRYLQQSFFLTKITLKISGKTALLILA